MRIIAGTLKSRRIHCPAGLAIRPSGDRLKESLFNILAPRISGAQFLDLYAGTGAVGLEAWSRGAARVVLVEKDRKALRCLEANLKNCGVEEGIEVLATDVLVGLARLAGRGESFDFIFLDPPYQDAAYGEVLQAVAGFSLLASKGWIIVEHRKTLAIESGPGGFARFRSHRVGDSVLSFFQSGDS